MDVKQVDHPYLKIQIRQAAANQYGLDLFGHSCH
jgi:hypothetical protein